MGIKTRMSQRRGTVVFAIGLLVVAYVLVAWYLTVPGTFWSVDSSVRFVQLESLRRQGYRTLAVIYPAEDLDAEHRFYPSTLAYRKGGRTYLSIPWQFPMLAAPFYGVFGWPGLLVLPVVGALASSWLTGVGAREDGQVPASAAVLLVGLASPLLVYAGVFWDHTISAALAAGAVALLVLDLQEASNRRAWWAGVLLGAGPWFRNEGYLFAVATLAGVWAGERRSAILPLLRGMSTLLLPLWVYNLWWSGHPLGYKGRAALESTMAPGLLGYLQNRVLVAYDTLLSVEHYTRASQPERLAEAAGLAAQVVLGRALLRQGLERGSAGYVAAGGVALAGVAVVINVLRLPVMGLIPSAPFVVLAWLRGIPDARSRLLGTVAVVYLVVLVAGAGYVGGLQWGPRYLLPTLPVLAMLCSRTLGGAWTDHPHLRGVLRGVLVLLVASGLWLQTLGLRFIRGSLEAVQAVEGALRSAPYEVLATGFEPLFRLTGHLYFEKKLMAVDSQQELRELVLALARAKVAGWTYVPRFPSFDANLVTRWTEGLQWRFVVESDQTPMVIEFGGVRPVRLVIYRGVPGSP